MDFNAAQELVPNVSTEKELKQYTGIPGRILKMLCSGCSPEEAASAVGVDSSYVRHLKQEPDFIAQIKKQLTENAERAAAIDENYVAIEKQATDKLKTLVPLIHTPRDLIAIAQFANSAKKKTGGVGGNGGEEPGTQKTVKILMPTVILNNFTTNVQNEIVAAGGRTLTTLNSASMASLVGKIEEQEKQQLAIEQKQPALLPELGRPEIPVTIQTERVNRGKNYVSPEDLDQL